MYLGKYVGIKFRTRYFCFLKKQKTLHWLKMMNANCGWKLRTEIADKVPVDTFATLTERPVGQSIVQMLFKHLENIVERPP